MYNDVVRYAVLHAAAALSLLGAMAAMVLAGVLGWQYWEAHPTLAAEPPAVKLEQPAPGELPPEYSPPPVPTPTPDLRPLPSPTSRPTPRPDPRPRIGIIAGHWKNDSGAVCEDTGLQEVHVTLPVAEGVVDFLTRRGYNAELLAEFDPLIDGYEAHAMVSIHADSCLAWEGLTGFKVARSAVSAIPEIEDELVACLYSEYGEATGLPRHDTSITENMTRYHAFRKVDLKTPSAIIELGFLYNDRDVLTQHQDQLVRGIAEGIVCFLRTQQE